MTDHAPTIFLCGPGLSGKTTLARRVGWRPPTRDEIATQSVNAYYMPRRIIVERHAANLVFGFRGGSAFFPPFGKPWPDPWRREAAMRNCAAARGVLFVADSQELRLEANIEQIEMLQQDLEYIGRNPTGIPLVFALNKRDLPNAMTVDWLKARLKWPTCDYVETSARRDIGIQTAFLRLLELIDGTS